MEQGTKDRFKLKVIVLILLVLLNLGGISFASYNLMATDSAGSADSADVLTDYPFDDVVGASALDVDSYDEQMDARPYNGDGFDDEAVCDDCGEAGCVCEVAYGPYFEAFFEYLAGGSLGGGGAAAGNGLYAGVHGTLGTMTLSSGDAGLDGSAAGDGILGDDLLGDDGGEPDGDGEEEPDDGAGDGGFGEDGEPDDGDDGSEDSDPSADADDGLGSDEDCDNEDCDKEDCDGADCDDEDDEEDCDNEDCDKEDCDGADCDEDSEDENSDDKDCDNEDCDNENCDGEDCDDEDNDNEGNEDGLGGGQNSGRGGTPNPRTGDDFAMMLLGLGVSVVGFVSSFVILMVVVFNRRAGLQN